MSLFLSYLSYSICCTELYLQLGVCSSLNEKYLLQFLIYIYIFAPLLMALFVKVMEPLAAGGGCDSTYGGGRCSYGG